MGIRATGKIVRYQLSFSLLEFAQFGLTYVLLHNGFSPEWSYLSGIVIAVFKIGVMWYLSKLQLGISIRAYLKDVFLPMLIVSIVSATIPSLIHFAMPYGWPRFLAVLFISIIVSASCIIFLGCNAQEQKLLISMVVSKFKPA